MKKKIVLWGTDENDKKILIALALKEKENKVDLHTFNEDLVTEVFYNLMMDDWRSGGQVEFPEGHVTIERELSVTEDLLPETIKVQRTDLITRAKAEWHFVVLSTKLYDLYNSELEDLKERIDKLVDFDNNIWEEVKGFWSKVSQQSQERNIFREHAQKLKNETNTLFAKLKEFKSKANAELAVLSKEHLGRFVEKLDAVKEKAAGGKSLSPLFDELKKIQNEFNGTEFTRNDRSKVWKKIDEAFKLVKEKKYGKSSDNQQGAVSRVARRYQGLKSAIGKMQASINRDKKDIEFQNKRAGTTHGQLEMQLRQAKVMMIEERIQSKQEKLDEMLATQVDLEKRLEKENAKAAKLAEKKIIEQKKAELKEKIKSEIDSSKPEISEEKAAKLAAAAADINAPKGKRKKAKKEEAPKPEIGTEAKSEEAKQVQPEAEESMLGAATTMIEEAIENVVDTVKAVGSVVADKMEDQVEAIKEKVESASEEKVEVSEAETGELAVTAEDSDSSETVKKAGVIATAVAAGAMLVKEAKEKISDAAEDVGLNDTLDKAKAAIKESVSAVTEEVAEIKEDITEKVVETKAKISEKVSDARKTEVKGKEVKEGEVIDEEVKEEKEGLLGAAFTLGAKVVDSVSDKVEELAEKTGLDDTLDKAKTKLEEAKDFVSDKVEDVKADLAGGAKSEDSEDKTTAKAGDALKKGGLLATAVAAGSKLVKEASDKLEDVAEKVGLDDTIEKAKATLQESKEAISDKVGEAKAAFSEATESVDEVADRVRKESKGKSEEE